MLSCALQPRAAAEEFATTFAKFGVLNPRWPAPRLFRVGARRAVLLVATACGADANPEEIPGAHLHVGGSRPPGDVRELHAPDEARAARDAGKQRSAIAHALNGPVDGKEAPVGGKNGRVTTSLSDQGCRDLASLPRDECPRGAFWSGRPPNLVPGKRPRRTGLVLFTPTNSLT